VHQIWSNRIITGSVCGERQFPGNQSLGGPQLIIKESVDTSTRAGVGKSFQMEPGASGSRL
jgi:hypothetical protein